MAQAVPVRVRPSAPQLDPRRSAEFVSNPLMSMIAPILGFLKCRTPDRWVSRAVADIPTLLQDHASLELKAAQQAQSLIRRYAGRSGLNGMRLLNKMSRLAREELRHFEQVLALMEKRGVEYQPISASRYAATLHSLIRGREPARLVDTLIVGAIIEARSCERFDRLVDALRPVDPELANFYRSLVKSEARHFADYLALAEDEAGESVDERVDEFLESEQALILEPDPQLRFHSGVPN